MTAIREIAAAAARMGGRQLIMSQEELIPHLFRTEYRKIVAVLCKHFGFDQMETAEDIASDTFVTASQAWGVEGAPRNPTAWLYLVARNKAKNYLQRAHHSPAANRIFAYRGP
jgi:predicted RNA polymerase sigma factor